MPVHFQLNLRRRVWYDSFFLLLRVKIINDALKQAAKLLKDHRKSLDAVANKLLEVETLEKEEFEQIVGKK